MKSFVKEIEAATADSGPDIRAALEGFAKAAADAEKDFAAREVHQEADVRAVEARIEQITKQLGGKSGLTNEKRKVLNKERDEGLRWLRQIRLNEDRPEPKADDTSSPKAKATGKKLRWLARKLDRETGLNPA